VSSRPPRWTRDELILALALYFEVGAADYRSSRPVQHLSEILRTLHADEPYLDDPKFRSPSAVSRKLKNIAWIDPENTRGTAQSHGSAVDEEIWDEFADDRAGLAREAKAIRLWIEAGVGMRHRPSASPPEIADTMTVVAEQAGRRSLGQGFLRSAALRSEIEHYAMAQATRYFSVHGWTNVEDVSRTRCFDLICQRGSSELRVEVKGTTSEGSRILLTRNEVTHARRVFPRIALYVLADIVATKLDDGNYRIGGGVEIIRNPWDIDAGNLQALAFEYEVPADA
jgi:hypothetical protein